jgi:hypothetical protein
MFCFYCKWKCGNAVTYNSDCKNAKQEITMPLKTYTDVNGDRYIYKYVGKVEPDAETVINVYNGKSKDIRIKGVKLKKGSQENISTAEGLTKNAARGLTFSLSRKAENNSRALDQWNKENPVKSIAADVVGSTPFNACGTGT